MCSDIVVNVDNVSKSYQIYDKPSHRLKQSIATRFAKSRGHQAPRYYSEFWALRNVNFEVQSGQSVGIVGRNGSGKSTLLQIICGTLAASGGTVSTKGRIGALLELGSAFNPEFTGRENVFMNAAVLGFKESDTKSRFDAIVDFADVEGFIDQPVKTYSSGMRLRLAFAVQAQLEPDILIVDEALAVGDARFKAKCFARLRRLKESGTSILLVSHATEQVVTHCDSAILLDRGEQLTSGEPRQVVNQYLDLMFGSEAKSEPDAKQDQEDPNIDSITGRSDTPVTADSSLAVTASLLEKYSERPNYNPHEYRWGDGAARILDFSLSDANSEYPTVLHSGSKVTLTIQIYFERDVVRPILGITIKSKEGVTVFGSNTERLQCETMKSAGLKGSSVRVVTMLNCGLGGGDYFISVGIASRGPEGVVPHDRRYDSIHLKIHPQEASYGLVDMNISMTTELIEN